MKLFSLNLGPRTTTEIVVLMFSCVVCFSLLFLVVGAVLLRLMHPTAEMKPAAELVTNIISTIIGALVGFIGGRAAAKSEVMNGEKKPPTP
jgi:putative flippase GtrA